MVLDFNDEKPRTDLATTIMQERIERGVKIVKDEAEKNKIAFDKDLFVKGCEIGISLFIQKEKKR